MGISENLKENKYVAFLDVLGFKEIVKKKGEELDAYFETIHAAIDIIDKAKPNLEYRLVSDSTILSCDLGRDNLKVLLTAVQTIQTRCALQNLWIRGAISIGDIHFDKDIVVGNGLTNAYLLESQEKFPRVIIDPKIIGQEFSNREVFIHCYNHNFIGPGSELNKIPLIHFWRGDVGSKFIEDDAIFVSFGERIADDNTADLEIIYQNIRSGIYQGQNTYAKYLWLKNYFSEVASLIASSYGPFDTTDKSDLFWEYWTKFRAL